MGKWTNNDGLHVRLGNSENEYAKSVVTSLSPVRWGVLGVKFGQNLSSNSTTQLAGGRLDAESPLIIRKGSLILRALFVVDTAFSTTSSPTLDLGVSIAAGTYTGGAETGIAAAITAASIDTAGKVVDLSKLPGASGFGGAMISIADADGLYSAKAVDLYFSFDVDTAAFTAGEGRLLVEYLEPVALGPNTYK